MSTIETHHDWMMATQREAREEILRQERFLKAKGLDNFRIPRGSANPAMSPSQAVLCESLLHFRRFGQQTFLIGENLQEMFCQTSLRSVPRDAVRLPYDCFYLALPNCPWLVWGDDKTGWHKLGGAYIWIDHHAQQLIACLWGLPNERSKNQRDNPYSWCELDLDTAYSLEDAGDLETYLTRLFDPDLDYGSTENDLEEAFQSPEFDVKVGTTTLHNVYRVAINLMLYLQTEAAETRTRANPMTNERRRRLRLSRKKARALEPIIGPGTITVVGSSIEEKAAEEKERVRKSGGSPRMHWRRGHWHGYWVGPKGNQRLVQKWLMPMLVSRDAEEMAGKREYRLTPPSPDRT